MTLSGTLSVRQRRHFPLYAGHILRVLSEDAQRLLVVPTLVPSAALVLTLAEAGSVTGRAGRRE